MLRVAAAAFVLFQVCADFPPLFLDFHVGFQLRAGFNPVNAVFQRIFVDMVDQDGVDALPEQIMPHCNQRQLQNVGMLQIVQHAGKAKRKKMSFRFFERRCNRRERQTEPGQLVFLVDADADVIKIQQ